MSKRQGRRKRRPSLAAQANEINFRKSTAVIGF